MTLGLTDAGSMRPVGLALCPTLALLGIALPIFFLTSIDTYLYYLRPFELIPTYGTAWLLLAAPAVPASLVSWLALSKLGQPSTTASGVVVFALLGIAAATIVVALGYGVLVWLRTFGLLVNRPVGRELIALSLCAGLVVASIPATRAGLLSLLPLMSLGAALGALSLLTLPFCGWEVEPPPSRLSNPQASALHSKPHILLITIDSLAAERMSLYGAVRETTPRLKAFAREAITFDRAYANGNFTTPGISSILTGTRPWTHRALQLLSWPVPEARRNSLPALLFGAGYQTGYVATNFFAGAKKNGFGSYFIFQSSDRVAFFARCRDGLATVLRYHCAASASILEPLALPRLLRQFIPYDTHKSANREFDPQLAMRPALEWLAKADKRTPIFLWVHLLPPHSPYAAPEPWLGQFDSSPTARSASDSETKFEFVFRQVDGTRVSVLEARYDESVEYVDYYVGEYLKQALQLLGPNTTVVVTADHGESFNHGYGGHGGPGLFESLIHIPLIIKLPYQTDPIRVSVPAEQVDIAPTLASLVGMTPPASWEGRSLLPFVRDSETSVLLPAKPVFAMNFEENRSRSALTTGSVSVIDGRWKLVHFMGALHYPLMPQLHDELYDLSADPHELANRLPDKALEAHRLRELILRELAQRGAALP